MFIVELADLLKPHARDVEKAAAEVPSRARDEEKAAAEVPSRAVVSRLARAENLDSLTAVIEFEVPRHNNLNSSDSLGFANSIPLLATPCDGTARAVGGCLGMEVREDWSCTTGTMERFVS